MRGLIIPDRVASIQHRVPASRDTWDFKTRTVYVTRPLTKTQTATGGYSNFTIDNVPFGVTYEKIGTIQRRLAWPLHKDDTLFRVECTSVHNIYCFSYLSFLFPCSNVFFFLILLIYFCEAFSIPFVLALLVPFFVFCLFFTPLFTIL